MIPFFGMCSKTLTDINISSLQMLVIHGAAAIYDLVCRCWSPTEGDNIAAPLITNITNIANVSSFAQVLVTEGGRGRGRGWGRRQAARRRARLFQTYSNIHAKMNLEAYFF